MQLDMNRLNGLTIGIDLEKNDKILIKINGLTNGTR